MSQSLLCVLLLGSLWLPAGLGSYGTRAAAAEPLPTLEEIVEVLAHNEKSAAGLRVQADGKIRQRTGNDFEGPELHREVRIWFAVDADGRIRSEKDGGTPGRIGTTDVLPEKQLGTFDGKVARTLWGNKNYDFAHIGKDWTRLYREIDPRDYLNWHFNQPLSKTFTKDKYTVVGIEDLSIDKQPTRKVVVVESPATVRDDVSYKGRYLLDPERNYFALVRSAWIRYGDGPWCEYTNITAQKLMRDAGGVWLPEHSIYTSYNVSRAAAAKGAPFTISWRHDVTFHDWELNPEFTDVDFTLVIPPGVFVNDSINNTTYHQGEPK